MTRIIAGAIGSLQLRGAAKATRPTSDRVKESLFGKLDAMGAIQDAAVLDLFAGTGALGLECASRGALSVQFVEQDRHAFEGLSSNIKAAEVSLNKQGLMPDLKALNIDAKKFLKAAVSEFDLAFIDPPYAFHAEDLEQILLGLHGLLRDKGLVVVERSNRDQAPEVAGYYLGNAKTYGDTAIYLLNKR
ncbi:MAG: rRNA ((966)-N(2))-methyltransferase RsmD [Actinomycetota bacterium]